MLTFGNARLGNIHADLPTFFGFEQLGKTAARVQVHFQREGDFFFRQVGKIHGIQLFLKAAVGDFGHHQHLWLAMEAVEALNYVSERCFVRHRCVAVSAVFGQQGVHAVKFTVMLLALECIEHFLDQSIDKQHFQFDRRVLRTVDSNKIEHEIRLAAVFLKLRGRTVNIIFVDFIDHNMRACAVLAVVYVFEFFHKIFANEPFAPVTSIFIKRTYAFFFIVSQNSVLSSIFRKFVSVKMKQCAGTPAMERLRSA